MKILNKTHPNSDPWAILLVTGLQQEAHWQKKNKKNPQIKPKPKNTNNNKQA